MLKPICLLLVARAAHADPEIHDIAETATPETSGDRHLVYAEVLGKAGAYGVGYEFALTPRVSLGIEGSYERLRDQRLEAVVPYLHVTPWRRGPNAIFGELGIVVSNSDIAANVPRWMGTSTTSVGAVAAVGYERSWKRFVLRGAVSLLAGAGGAAPWAGVAIGVKP